MTKEVQDLIAAVEEQTSVEQGVQVAITGAVSRIDDLIAELRAAKNDPAEIARITAEMKEHTLALRQSGDSLAAAVVKGTESASTPVETPSATTEAPVKETPAPVEAVEPQLDEDEG